MCLGSAFACCQKLISIYFSFIFLRVLAKRRNQLHYMNTKKIYLHINKNICIHGVVGCCCYKI